MKKLITRLSKLITAHKKASKNIGKSKTKKSKFDIIFENIIKIIIAFLAISTITISIVRIVKNIKVKNSHSDNTTTIVTEVDNTKDVNSITIVNNRNTYINLSEEESIHDQLLNAENFFNREAYSQSFDIYRKLSDRSDIANLNIGYMYSKGLGCKPNYEEACNKYKTAFEMGQKELALDNYLAINLLTPKNINKTLEALDYCFKFENKNAIMYLSFLETSTMLPLNEENIEICKKNARSFLSKDLYSKQEAIKNNLEIFDSKILKNYEKSNDSIEITEPCGSEYQKIKVGTVEHWNPEIKKYELKTVYDVIKNTFFIVNSYQLKNSNCLFSEGEKLYIM